MGLLFEGRKTVECVKVGLSLDGIVDTFKQIAASNENASVKTYEAEDEGTACITFISYFVPKLLSDFTVECIARMTPLHPSAILKAMLTDRAAAAEGRLGDARGSVYVLEHTSEYSVIEYDLDELDRAPYFEKWGATGFPVLKVHAAAAGISLEYDPEPYLTLGDALNVLKRVSGIWEKVSREEWESRAKGRILAAEERHRRWEEERQRLIAEAKPKIVEGVASGRFETRNEAIAALEYEHNIVVAAWNGTESERAEAYWKTHPEKRREIENKISELESKLKESKSKEADMRKEIAYLTSSLAFLVKGKRIQQLHSGIAEEENRQTLLQEKIKDLQSSFDTMPR